MSKVITVQDGNLVLTAVATEVDGELQVGDTASADYLSISHDGTKATIATAVGMGGIEVNPASGTNFTVLGDASGGRIRAGVDGDPTSYIELHHSTVSVGWIISTDDIRFDSATDIVGVNSGHEFRMYGGIGTQWGSFQHDGTNLNLTAGAGTGTTDFVMGGSFTGNVKSEKSISILEAAAASADSLTYGQIWVQNTNPQTLMFTDGDGNIFSIGGALSGAVSATGSPLNNEIAVFTDGTTLDSDATFTWDGTTLSATAITVDNIGIDLNTISTTSGALNITPFAGSAIVLDGTISVDAGVVTGATSITSTGVTVSGLTDNRVVIAGTGGVLEGDANFTWTGTTLAIAGAGAQLLLPSENDVATPTLAFGDGDTGFYESADDVIQVALAGVIKASFTSSRLTMQNGAVLSTAGATSVVPTLIPTSADLGTGIGRAAANQLSLIAGSVEANRITAATLQTTAVTTTEIISIPVASGEGFGFEIHIMGTEDSTGDTVFERVFGAIRNQGGTTALVGSTIVDRTDDATASTWVITVAADDTGDALTVDVAGEAAHTIDWKVRVELLNV